ncbi:hypothetical protein ILYODFUR_009052 [Ilyodon furcidens]|uniref:Peptidylprolyl isomerase n=1 Tax=Ilyodon furcidens TaxID=33524 RepID=A0ABV0V3B1_9TELE
MYGEPHEPGKVISGEQLLHPPNLTCRFSQGIAGMAHLQRFQPVRWVSFRPPNSSKDGGVAWLHSTVSILFPTSVSSPLRISTMCKVSFNSNCSLTRWSISNINLR